MREPPYDAAIIGGGPAGATAAIHLARLGFRTCVVERRAFPRETLCGEFLSREVLQILDALGLAEYFRSLRPNPLTAFRYCPERTRSFSSTFRFPAYGMKRGAFDAFLLDHARDAGATIYQPATVERVLREGPQYDLLITIPEGRRHLTARRVIAAYGKSNPLDKALQRDFLRRKSRLNGVKFHVPRRCLNVFPEHEIQIFTSRNAYCGVNAVNDDTATVCFLERRSEGDPPPRTRIAELRHSNPHFARLVTPDFESAMDDAPIYGAGNIFFGEKRVVEDGIFMVGDAARVIAPLAGDGIGMAMQSGKIVSTVFDETRKNHLSEQAMDRLYSTTWRSFFQRRLQLAGTIQHVLFSRYGRGIGSSILSAFPATLSSLIEHTRG